LKVIQKKLDNYQRLNQRIREEQEEGGVAAGGDEEVKHQVKQSDSDEDERGKGGI